MYLSNPLNYQNLSFEKKKVITSFLGTWNSSGDSDLLQLVQHLKI